MNAASVVIVSFLYFVPMGDYRRDRPAREMLLRAWLARVKTLFCAMVAVCSAECVFFALADRTRSPNCSLRHAWPFCVCLLVFFYFLADAA